MQLVPCTIAIIIILLLVPTNSYHHHHHHHNHFKESSEPAQANAIGVIGDTGTTNFDTTFLSADDFDRAHNLSLSESETSPVPMVMVQPLNDPEMHYTYYEGDMMLQESEEKNIAMYTAKRWPHGRIPYIMENKFNEDERAAIARGMMILQERTCIRFMPKEAGDYDYVLMKRGPGCAAHVGRIGGQQWVILGDGCYGLETVTHELMHAVGFIHEQSRPDRDDHVEIVWNNIKPNAKRNFKKHDYDYLANHGFPYDLMSVMHYRQYAFSKNRKPTILPKRPVPYLRCRGLDCPSELDIKKINFLYKCHRKGAYAGDNYPGGDVDGNSIGDDDDDDDDENEIDVDELITDHRNNNHNKYNNNPNVDHHQFDLSEFYGSPAIHHRGHHGPPFHQHRQNRNRLHELLLDSHPRTIRGFGPSRLYGGRFPSPVSGLLPATAFIMARPYPMFNLI